MLEQEVQDALNAALSNNILKEDSLLQRNVTQTWTAQKNLEDVLEQFKIEMAKTNNPTLSKLGGQIEDNSNELKKSITDAIKQIDKTKLQIIKILDKHDLRVSKREFSTEKPHPGDETNFYGRLSRDFNDVVEEKKSLN